RNALGEPGDGGVFSDAVARINADREVRCVILTGAGSAFSAGGNIKAMQKREGPFGGAGAHIADGYRRGIHQIVKSLWGLEVPAIAAVNGPAIGLGNDVACLCDMRIASEKAIFGATFLKVGLIPGDGGAWLLPRIIGGARASELLFTGKTISADEALTWGLVSQVVSDDKLLETAQDMAHQAAAQSAEALRSAKRLMRHGQTADFATIMEMSANAQALMHLSEDHTEAVSAMLEKRSAEYKDK
ncbi:MAG: crotonase/enoyl-CoA hydratase family protein, partial [Alphaproteobacteria bacterium]|nr:crotonase/enoyl-CoA hydratase family protein [Alphaproteobacteria bacterium]